MVVALSISSVQGWIADHDVGRVCDDGVVLAAGQRLDKGVLVLGGVGEIVLDGEQSVLVVAEPQGVAGEHVDAEAGGVLERAASGGVERGDGEPEPRDGDGERVEVDAPDRVQGLLHALSGAQAGGFGVPAGEDATERAEQEVSGAAGGVDELEAVEWAVVQGGGEGAVEDELFDELGVCSRA